MKQQVLYLSAAVVVVLGFVHSYLGERQILPRLLGLPNLPLLRRDPRFTRNIHRLVWHAPSLAWWALAALVIVLAEPNGIARGPGIVLAAAFLITGLAALASGRRHPAWPLFLLAGAGVIYGM